MDARRHTAITATDKPHLPHLGARPGWAYRCVDARPTATDDDPSLARDRRSSRRPAAWAGEGRGARGPRGLDAAARLIARADRHGRVVVVWGLDLRGVGLTVGGAGIAVEKRASGGKAPVPGRAEESVPVVACTGCARDIGAATDEDWRGSTSSARAVASILSARSCLSVAGCASGTGERAIKSVTALSSVAADSSLLVAATGRLIQTPSSRATRQRSAIDHRSARSRMQFGGVAARVLSNARAGACAIAVYRCGAFPLRGKCLPTALRRSQIGLCPRSEVIRWLARRCGACHRPA